MALDVDRVAELMFRAGMIRVGRFRLTSGIESPYYIDLRKLYSYPSLAREIAETMIARINVYRFEALVGIATAGIALASYVAALSGLPMGYVRSERKEHGTMSVVEGAVEGLRVLILDDVATTGGSIERAYRALREAGAKPVAAAVVVDRCQGARERLESLGLEFASLFTARQLIESLRRKGLISEGDYERVVRYIESFKKS